MRVTLSEIKKKIQSTNNGVVEAKCQANDLEIRKKKHSIREAKRKKNPEKQG